MMDALLLVCVVGAPGARDVDWRAHGLGASALGETLGREHRRPPTQTQSTVTQ